MTTRDLKEKKKEKCLPYFGQKSLLLQARKVSFLVLGNTVQGTITTFILIIISHNSVVFFVQQSKFF